MFLSVLLSEIVTRPQGTGEDGYKLFYEKELEQDEEVWLGDRDSNPD
jgi:hypothetical protein